MPPPMQSRRPALRPIELYVLTPWFRKEVQKGLASLDSGKVVSHEEVGRRMERIP
jgi:predicted transcriptional regulator